MSGFFATDESSCFRPVVEIFGHEENLQDAVEVTCVSLIIKAIVKSLWLSHFTERKTQCYYTIFIHLYMLDYDKNVKNIQNDRGTGDHNDQYY